MVEPVDPFGPPINRQEGARMVVQSGSDRYPRALSRRQEHNRTANLPPW
jgi:hypothetical protein